MNNGKRTMENEEHNSAGGEFSINHYSLPVNLICPACGAAAQRETARFCLVCGKHLREDYEPLDRLRSSYRLQGKTFDLQPKKKEETINLFEENKNSVSQTAWACFVYSLVPYLGILFIPLTFLIGGVGFIVAYRQPQSGGRKLSLVSFILSFVVLAVQIFLWWLLYIIPELGQRI
ncbi:MAG TPA: zinc ribbon domain-containing protein [Pyrinomonadaceae bacterium]